MLLAWTSITIERLLAADVLEFCKLSPVCVWKAGETVALAVLGWFQKAVSLPLVFDR